MMMNQDQDCKSVGIEHIPELAKLSTDNISKNYYSLIEQNKVIIVEGDGRQGCPQYGPYDCIHVGAAAEDIPKCLIE